MAGKVISVVIIFACKYESLKGKTKNENLRFYYLSISEGEKMSELTFGDIFRKFEKQYPYLNIDDWRPYGRNTITVWIRANDEMTEVEIIGVKLRQAKNVVELAFEYDTEKDVFIFKGKSDYAKFIGAK